MEEQAPTPGGAPAVLVAAGRRQVWRPMLTMLLFAVPLAVVGVVAAVVRPEAGETWAGAAIFAAAVCVLMGLDHALLRRLGPGRHRVAAAAGGCRSRPWAASRRSSASA